MVKITTAAGKTLEVDSVWGPLFRTNELMIDMVDARPLCEIAADFDKPGTIVRHEDKKDIEYAGYTHLRGIYRDEYAVHITMSKE